MFLSFVSLRDRQGDEETCGKGAEMSGDHWRTEDAFCFHIYSCHYRQLGKQV